MVRGSLAWFRRNAFRLHPSQRILRGLRPLVSVGPLPLTLPRVARHPNFPSPSETYLPIIIRHISYVQTCFLPIRLPPPPYHCMNFLTLSLRATSTSAIAMCPHSVIARRGAAPTWQSMESLYRQISLYRILSDFFKK